MSVHGRVTVAFSLVIFGVVCASVDGPQPERSVSKELGANIAARQGPIEIGRTF